jgi:hypothetical protein
LLSVGAESFVFQVAIQKSKIRVQKYNFTCCFYGCETLPLILREEQRLGVFENAVLRRIFGPKRDEVTGEWRRLHNGNLMICTHHQI